MVVASVVVVVVPLAAVAAVVGTLNPAFFRPHARNRCNISRARSPTTKSSAARRRSFGKGDALHRRVQGWGLGFPLSAFETEVRNKNQSQSVFCDTVGGRSRSTPMVSARVVAAQPAA